MIDSYSMMRIYIIVCPNALIDIDRINNQTFKDRKRHNTVKPVKSGHIKTDKTNILMTNGGLMKVVVE